MKTSLMIVLVVLFFVSCNSNDENKNEQKVDSIETIIVTKNQFEQAQMQLGKIKKQCFHEKIKANGKIVSLPEGMVSVSFPFNATLAKIWVLDGTNVEKGQPIISLSEMKLLKFNKIMQPLFQIFNQLKKIMNAKKSC
jgi:biotin carboxyl carrier protein